MDGLSLISSKALSINCGRSKDRKTVLFHQRSERSHRSEAVCNRTYRQSDIDTILKIKDLLYSQKYTIEGARERLKSGGVQLPQGDVETTNYKEVLKSVKAELVSLLKSLDQ